MRTPLALLFLTFAACSTPRSAEEISLPATEQQAQRPGSGDGPTPDGPILTAPFFPKLGALDLASTSRRLDVADGVAFVALEFFGFVAVDVSDPSRPRKIAEVPIRSATGVYDLDVHEGYLYVAANELGLFGFDVRNPHRPAELFQVPSFRFDGSVLGVFARGDRLYVTAGGGGVSVWDISDPAAFDAELYCVGGQPTPCPDGDCSAASLLGCYQEIPFVDYFRDAVVRGSVLVAPTLLGGIVALDVSDPANIFSLGSAREAPGQAFDVAYTGDVAFAASIGFGLVAADLTLLPLVAPLPILSSVPAGGFSGAEGIEVFSKRGGPTYAYLATFEGLDVFDVTDPAAPVLVEHLEGRHEVRDAVVRNGRLYLANGTRGLAIYGAGL